MSVLSDDTDVLLLIPPNFFTINSDSEEEQVPHKYKVNQEIIVNDLISQVNDLEGRLCMIENGTINNARIEHLDVLPSIEAHASISDIRDNSEYHILDHSNTNRHVLSLGYRSLQSSPIKNKVSYLLSLPSSASSSHLSCTDLCVHQRSFCNNSMDKPKVTNLKTRSNVLATNEYLLKKERDLTLLKEIDDFFKTHKRSYSTSNVSYTTDNENVESMTHTEKDSTQDKIDSNSELNTPAFNLSDVKELLKQMQERDLEIEHKLQSKEHVLNKDSNWMFPRYQSTQGDCSTAIEDTGRLSSNNSFISSYSHENNPITLSREKEFSTLSSYNENLDLLKNCDQSTTSGIRKQNQISRKLDFKSPEKYTSELKCKKSWSPYKNDNSSSTCFDKKEMKSYVKYNQEEEKKTTRDIKILDTKMNEGSIDRIEKDSGAKSLDTMVNENKNVCGKNSSANLISLSKLWGSDLNLDKTNTTQEICIIKQRLEEERYRRKHCEETIQALQLQVLEEQQRLSFAVKVDQEKDRAILKMKENWDKLINHWQEIEHQRNILTQQIQTERMKFKEELTESSRNLKQSEVELSKALDLAHGYKKKCESADQEKIMFKGSYNKEIESLKIDLKETKEKLANNEEECKVLLDKCAKQEDSIQQARAKNSDLQNHLRDARKKIKELEAEQVLLKQEIEKLNHRINEEKSKVVSLEQSKKSLQMANEELKKKEKMLKDEIKSTADQLEKTKGELKDFYQKQVESVVKEKLKEFQEQLSAAESSLHKELEIREQTVTEMALKQVQQIMEKHMMEINLIEEKHKEETELWKIQLAQAEEKISELQNKLQVISCHKNEIAERLHNIMETQWQEALKILSSPSPRNSTNKNTARSSKTQISDSPKSQAVSRQNTFTMSSRGDGLGFTNKDGLHLASESSSTTTTDTPFCKDGQITYRDNAQSKPQNSGHSEDNPLTYRVNETPEKIPHMSQGYLKQYIQMLLERTPGCPVGDASTVNTSLNDTRIDRDGNLLNQCSSTSQTHTHWQHILADSESQVCSLPSESHLLFNSARTSVPISAKSTSSNKPPWK